MVQKDGQQTRVFRFAERRGRVGNMDQKLLAHNLALSSTEILTLHFAPQTQNNLINRAVVQTCGNYEEKLH